MSYRARRRVPYVHALAGGLGRATITEVPPSYSGPWYGEILSKIADPLSGALAQRIAFGKQDPLYSGYGYGSTYGAGGYSSFGGFGGISPTMLLLGGAALLAVMMLRK